jgi:hypothetical protein
VAQQAATDPGPDGVGQAHDPAEVHHGLQADYAPVQLLARRRRPAGQVGHDASHAHPQHCAPGPAPATSGEPTWITNASVATTHFPRPTTGYVRIISQPLAVLLFVVVIAV